MSQKNADPFYRDTDGILKIESFYHIVQMPEQGEWSFAPHSHSDFLELSLVVDGEARMECGHQTYVLSQGDLLVKNPGVMHSEISCTERRFEQYCLGISGVRKEGLPENALIPEGISQVLHTGAAFDYLRAMMGYLFGLSGTRQPQAPQLVRGAVENALSVISMLVEDELSLAEYNACGQFVEEVLDYIDANFSRQLSLENLARHFSVSSSYLSHKFKQETGSTVNQYLMRRRMGEAEKLLAFGDTPVKEVAVQCGYGDLQYFYAVFKKYVGRTPVEFRNYYRTIGASGG